MEENDQQEEGTQVSTKTRNIIILVVLVLFSVGVVYYANSWFAVSSSPENPEVVARVNEEEITREEFENAREQLLNNLENDEVEQEVTDEQLDTQTLSSLISRVLIRQRMRAYDLQVPDEELQAKLDVLRSNFETEEEFLQQLEEQGITEQQIIDQITSEIRMRIFLEKVFGQESFIVTEEDTENYYNENIAVLENPKPLEEIKKDVEMLVLQQKQQEKLDELLQKLQESSDIQIFLDQ